MAQVLCAAVALRARTYRIGVLSIVTTRCGRFGSSTSIIRLRQRWMHIGECSASFKTRKRMPWRTTAPNVLQMHAPDSEPSPTENALNGEHWPRDVEVSR